MGSRDLADVTVKVVSNYDISVTAMSENSGSLNTFQVLPVASLGEEYYVPLIYSTMPGIATISALSEETKVTIKFSRKVSVGKVASTGKVVSTGDVIQQNLNSFQTYQVYISRAYDQDDDHVVVMHLEADRPVAVVSGSICARMSPGHGTCDYLVEQFPPFNQWGQRFTIPSFLNRKKYSMLVIAGRDKTVVNTTDKDPFEMNQGEHNLNTVTGGLRSLESINRSWSFCFQRHGKRPRKESISDRSNVTRRGTMCVSHLEVTPGYHTFRHEHDTASYMLMSYGFGLKVGYSHIISFNTSPVTCQAYDDIRDVTKEYMCEDVNQSFCPENETEDGGEIVSWPKSDIFKTINSTKICPLTFTKAGIPIWSRRCNLTDDLEVTWNDPIRNDCGGEISINKPEDLLTAEVTTGNVEEVSSTLQHITEEIEDISNDDVTNVAQTLTKVVGTGSSSKSVTNSVVRTVDTVLTDLSKAEVSDGQFNTMDTAFSTSEMVQMMDQQLQQTLEVEDNFTITEDAIQVQAFHLDVTDNPGDYTINPIKQTPEDTHTSVVLPKAIFATQETTVSVTFVLYRDDALFRPPSNSLKEKPAPELVLSVSVVTSTKIEKLLQPVVLNFPRPQNNRTISRTTSCVFWDFHENNGVGDWSEEGCKYAGATDDSVACECDHLTNFAVLMDYTDEVEEMSEAYTAFLDILTKIGCTVSIIGLIVTLVIFAIFKRLRTSRPRRILVHLCISLLCLYITFLFGIDSAINSEWACPMVAGLIHYFLLCAIFWMGVEAMNIYLMLVRVFNMNISRFVLKGAIAAWGGPLVIVGICMAASIEQYSDNGFCFLDQGNVFYIGLIAPMALVLIHNIIIFMLVFRNLMNANLAGTVHGKKTDMDLLKERLQNALTMTILMGLTWSFGFLMIGHTKFIFQLLFCLFNSFQGLLVFVLFCWRQEDVRKTLRPHCLSAKRKSKEVVGAKADYDITSTMTGQQSARVSTEVRKNVTSTGSTSSTVLLSPNRTKMNNNFRDSVSHV
ncbi:putative G-protein coupled receptor [Apostichopus japonicus]|uniref:Putative G-protein coupled receptor n=1 Tax=Stichopus japonicus TaxID=307972 RepID=A0A2G8KAI1_STIJA|nr:putative G-protein coupled receptor [Apostichopus japonicus]